MIEIMQFRLRPDVDEGTFREADARVQSDFAYQQPGLLRRTTARADDGEWLVVDVWRSASDADACSARWDADATVQTFMALVDPHTVRSARYRELDA